MGNLFILNCHLTFLLINKLKLINILKNYYNVVLYSTLLFLELIFYNIFITKCCKLQYAAYSREPIIIFKQPHLTN
jgi:hypothetical protein